MSTYIIGPVGRQKRAELILQLFPDWYHYQCFALLRPAFTLRDCISLTNVVYASIALFAFFTFLFNRLFIISRFFLTDTAMAMALMTATRMAHPSMVSSIESLSDGSNC